MKTTTSFWKRCLAWAMALVLLVSGSNLGVALQAFATEDGGASLTAGEIVAAHYDLPEGQKALLKSMTSVSMPDTIQEMGTAAFNTSDGVTSVHLSEALTAIPAGAFLKMDTAAPALEEVKIPSKVATIGANAFAGCKVKTLSLSEGLTVINGSAFLNHQLSAVVLPSTVTTLGSSAFSIAAAFTHRQSTSIACVSSSKEG